MRNLARLSQRLYNAPLLIAPEKADVIDGVFRAALEQRYEKAEPEPLAMEMMVAATPFSRVRAGYMRSDSGIALIQVLGPLVQRGAGVDAMSGGFESYENIGKQLNAALNDPMVLGILLELDSPGGEANGVAELAASVRAADAQKPVMAHANEFAFSAAYWLAAAASELYVPATGMVGSVGVVMLHVDQSQLNAKRGLEVTHIIGGAHKADFSPHQPLSDAALENAQAMVNRLYGQFVDGVAASRGISADAVRATEAGLLNPDEAEAIGMVDGTATLDQTIQRLAEVIREPGKRKQYGSSAASPPLSSTGQTKEIEMTEAAKGAAPNQPAAITQADLDKARSEGIELGKKEAATAAQATEKESKAKADVDAKERVKAILGCDAAKERPLLAKTLALETDMTPEAANVVLAAAAKETGGNQLDAAMRGSNPKLGADGQPEKPQAGKADTSTDVYARMNQQRLLIINGGAK